MPPRSGEFGNELVMETEFGNDLAMETYYNYEHYSKVAHIHAL